MAKLLGGYFSGVETELNVLFSLGPGQCGRPVPTVPSETIGAIGYHAV